VKFPKIIQNKKTKAEVTIYGKSKGGERKKDGSCDPAIPVLSGLLAGDRPAPDEILWHVFRSETGG